MLKHVRPVLVQECEDMVGQGLGEILLIQFPDTTCHPLTADARADARAGIGGEMRPGVCGHGVVSFHTMTYRQRVPRLRSVAEMAGL
ncbi:MAG TPA: hypothetical protein VD970_17490 [Acetobacteraceae bacterium]|nr:hypothetical protein [Acetobacteraceae bacterium]